MGAPLAAAVPRIGRLATRPCIAAFSRRKGLHPAPPALGREAMDKDRIEGAGKQVKGAIKEGVGNLTGDEKMKAEGRMDKAEGKVQNTIGGAKDAVRDAVNKDRT